MSEKSWKYLYLSNNLKNSEQTHTKLTKNWSSKGLDHKTVSDDVIFQPHIEIFLSLFPFFFDIPKFKITKK